MGITDYFLNRKGHGETVVKIIEIVEEYRMCWEEGAEKYRAALEIQE